MTSILMHTEVRNVSFGLVCCNDCPCFKYEYYDQGGYWNGTREVYECSLHKEILCDVDDRKQFMKIPEWCGFNGSLKDIRSIING